LPGWLNELGSWIT